MRRGRTPGSTSVPAAVERQICPGHEAPRRTPKTAPPAPPLTGAQCGPAGVVRADLIAQTGVFRASVFPSGSRFITLPNPNGIHPGMRCGCEAPVQRARHLGPEARIAMELGISSGRRALCGNRRQGFTMLPSRGGRLRPLSPCAIIRLAKALRQAATPVSCFAATSGSTTSSILRQWDAQGSAIERERHNRMSIPV